MANDKEKKPKDKDAAHEQLDEALRTFDNVVIMGWDEGEEPTTIPVEAEGPE
jgi:hypothetical protein